MPKNKFPNWVFSFALFPLGLGGFVLGGLDVWEGLQSRSWPQAQAVVLSSQLEPSMLAPHQPAIRYSYMFEGRLYLSNRIWPGRTLSYMPLMRGENVRKLLTEFPEGGRPTVFVNPRQPAEAVLKPGAGKAVLWMGIFTFFVFVGFWAPLALARLKPWS